MRERAEAVLGWAIKRPAETINVVNSAIYTFFKVQILHFKKLFEGLLDLE